MIKSKLGIVLIVISIVITIIIRLTNIEISETKLFIQYFYIWVVLIIVIILGGYLCNK